MPARGAGMGTGVKAAAGPLIASIASTAKPAVPDSNNAPIPATSRG